MVFDFGKHVSKKPATDLTDPLALFKSLDRKTTHTTLRPAQEAALKQLHSRRDERDAVLKMPTGTGKSSAGLLYLRAKAAASKRAAVYLCPTKQLVEQVLEEADRLGIKAHAYTASHPDPECFSGEALIVCTYDKLFNAKTTFNRPDVDLIPTAIVLDDAHAGVEEIRDAFSLTIKADETVRALWKILDGPARQYNVSRWEEITSGRRGVSSIEIPYWSWREVVSDVRHLLAAREDDRELMFVWPHLQEILPWCRCVVAPEGIEIVPSIPPVERVRAYREADHRLFMSATLADDSVLVRELGCDIEAALKPIAPAGGSFGERLVLVPSLIDKSLNLEWVQKLCTAACKKYRVVVLCSSERAARKWESYGARVVLGESVSGAIADLRSGAANFVCFANRYDGVDLPDEACRVLVLDGLPLGQGIADSHDGSIRGGFQARTTYRIEQGMGRAVRSDADYAVVILAGSDLASFTAKPEVREQLSPDARAQIELAHELPKMASGDSGSDKPAEVVHAMIRQCLSRESGWRSFYEVRVRDAVKSEARLVDEDRVRLAGAERAAAERAHAGNAPEAAERLQAALDRYLPKEHATDRRLARRRAYYMQVIASYMQEYDKGQALQLQDAAHDLDRDLLRPATAARKVRGKPATMEQPSRLLKHYATFPNSNAYLAELESIKANLSFDADPHRLERAIMDLAAFLGAQGSRPEDELGEGPDDLIQWATLSLVVEAKNDAMYDEIPKKDAEQLLHSMKWFEANYPAMKHQATPVLVCRVTKPMKGVHLPNGTRVLTPDGLSKLVTAVSQASVALAQKSASTWTEAAVFGLLNAQAISQERLLPAFTRPAE